MSKRSALSLNALTYAGPYKIQRTANQNDMNTIQIQYIGTLTASGAGTLNAVLDSYSQLTSSPDFTSAAALYAEYRVLSMHVQCEPYNKYNTPTTTSLTPVYTVVDRQNSTALASLNDAANYGSVAIHAPSSKITRGLKMTGTGEALWVGTGGGPSTDNRMYIKFYSAGNTASITMYDYLTTIIVQFKGRK